jgi:hypothetical protein
MRKKMTGCKPNWFVFGFVFAGDWWLLLASVADLTFDSVLQRVPKSNVKS